MTIKRSGGMKKKGPVVKKNGISRTPGSGPRPIAKGTVGGRSGFTSKTGSVKKQITRGGGKKKRSGPGMIPGSGPVR